MKTMLMDPGRLDQTWKDFSGTEIDYFIYSFPNRNLKCGSMFCGGGGDSITGKRTDYTVFGIECKVAVDDDKTRNINMVPNGARCGPNKVKLSSLTLNTGLFFPAAWMFNRTQNICF